MPVPANKPVALTTAAVWIMEPVVPELPRLVLGNRCAISRIKSRKFLGEKFLGTRYGKIIEENFAMLIGVIR